MTITLRSDISNDLKQNADQIGNVGKAISEFAWNSIQYQPEGQVPKIRICIKRARSSVEEITIEDNGRGMDLPDLQRFYTMHADNQDRRDGRLGRGRFGTGGKASGMAIANKMELTTVKDGCEIRTILTRNMLRPGVIEIPIPFEKANTTSTNGTKVTLRELRVKRFNEDAARTYVTKALGSALLHSEVFWDGIRLQYEEPKYLHEWAFEAPEEYFTSIGKVNLMLRLSESWLKEEERGVTITAFGVPHERNFLGNHASSPHAGRLYGSVEVPALEDDDDEGRPAYTADRTLRLNRENDRVKVLCAWIDEVLGDIIKQLDVEERQRIDRVRQERLTNTAKTIEDALNRRLRRAFENLERKLNLQTGAPTVGGVDVQHSDSIEISGVSDGGVSDEFIKDRTGAVTYRETGTEEKGDIIVKVHERHDEGGGGGGGGGTGEPDSEVDGVTDPAANKRARKKSTGSGERKTRIPKGSFRVVPKGMGSDGPRAYYASSHLTIYVNTDHPQLMAAGSLDSTEFKVLMAECAAGEFALALTSMRIENGDPEVDPTQWHTILTAVRNETNETAVELAKAIEVYRDSCAA
jgi:hypothetical protein